MIDHHEALRAATTAFEAAAAALAARATALASSVKNRVPETFGADDALELTGLLDRLEDDIHALYAMESRLQTLLDSASRDAPYGRGYVRDAVDLEW